DLLAVLVDEEDDLGVGVGAELGDDPLDLVELLLVHDDVGRRHSVILLPKPRGARPCADGSAGKLSYSLWLNEMQREGSQYSRRPSSAFAIVTSSAHSRSDPTGTPMAMRVTFTPSGLRRRAR